MSHKVAILTVNQKDSLVGEKLNETTYFNPVQDCNDNWIVSQEEIEQKIYSEFDWLDDLSLVDWCPPVIPPPSI